MADPDALTQALAGWETYERLGSPEGELAIEQVVIYRGTAPRSNAIYTAFVRPAPWRATGSLMPPAHILNAPTKQLGYGAGYEYDYGSEDAFSGRDHFPGGVERVRFYHLRDHGFERETGRHPEHRAALRAKQDGIRNDRALL